MSPSPLHALVAPSPSRGTGASGLRRWLRSRVALLLACLLTLPAPLHAADLFQPHQVHTVRIELTAGDAARLEKDPRAEVSARVVAGDRSWDSVGLHIKGRKGSLRPLRDKPSLTLTFDRFIPGQRWQGQRKIHLNNSVEDPSCLNEWLGQDSFQRVGVSAARVAHAVVTLQGRDLGLFVLKEAFEEEFLTSRFPEPSGAIYEGVDGVDVEGGFALKCGKAPSEAGALRNIAIAVGLPRGPDREAALERCVDLESFMNFLSTEVILGHRDGYGISRNNYRLRHDPASGRWQWIPHGMDQLLGNSTMPWLPDMAGSVARAALELPALRARYRLAMERNLPRVLDVERVTREVESLRQRLTPFVARPERRTWEEACHRLVAAVRERRSHLEAQLRLPEPKPLDLSSGPILLTGWRAVDPSGLTRLMEEDLPAVDGGGRAFSITAGSPSSSSWRTRVLLEPGSYRFTGRVRTRDVKPMPFARHSGAVLRVADFPSEALERLQGTRDWSSMAVSFVVTRRGEVELVCELRAGSGRALFESGSLRLERLRP